MAKDDPADLDFLADPAAAMVGEAGIVIADDPGPVERPVMPVSSSRAARRQPVAAEAVVEAVAEAVEAAHAGRSTTAASGLSVACES